LGQVENESEVRAGEVWVQVELVGPSGDVVAVEEVSLAVPHLAPGEAAPFEADFTDVDAAVSARAEVTRYLPSGFQRPQIQVGELSSAPMPDGEASVLGVVENRSGETIEVHEIAIAAEDDGGMRSVVPASAHRTLLEPGAQSPFMARLPAGLEEAALTLYVDATVAGALQPSRLELVAPPMLFEDEQGDPLVVGVIRNGSSRLGWASILVTVRAEGELVGVTQLAAPVPLGPGESRPFAAAEFPGMSSRWQRSDGLEALSLEVWVDPSPPAEGDLRLLPLEVELRSYEGIGGTLFLRGMVRNPLDRAVRAPTVLAAVRSIEGEPLAAGWQTVVAVLEPDADGEFLLALTLPRGTDLAMSEYDVVALGLAEAN
jgi:hypothetical protein